MKTLFSLSALAVALAANAAVEPGFKPLFNGTDLAGWQGNPKLWSVQDGTITGITGTNVDNKINHNTFLVYTNAPVGDFELRFSYKITGKGNSGVQYRSKVLRQGAFGPVVGGYQADFEGGKTFSGILYEEQGRGILAERGQKTVITEALFVSDTKLVTDSKTGAKKTQVTKREVKAISEEAPKRRRKPKFRRLAPSATRRRFRRRSCPRAGTTTWSSRRAITSSTSSTGCRRQT